MYDNQLLKTSRAHTEWKYPLRGANHAGWLEVDEEAGHHLYWEEYGVSDGEPVIVLHGGPGGGSNPAIVRYFNPFRFRVILFDQRGCGRSRPNVADHGADAALAKNNTNELINDIDKLRSALGISEPMHLFGGSWGSTLALLYSIRNCKVIKSLILHSVFIGTPEDLAYIYQGNASEYSERPFSLKYPGAYIFYPDEWRDFVEQISPEDRSDMLAAYKSTFAKSPEDEKERAQQVSSALAWSRWEGSISNAIPEPDRLGKFSDARPAINLATIESHYFSNALFIEPDFILRRAHTLQGVPVHIVHGRFDQICPLSHASRLVAALTDAGTPPMSFVTTLAGHSAGERENVLALTAVVDQLPM